MLLQVMTWSKKTIYRFCGYGPELCVFDAEKVKNGGWKLLRRLIHDLHIECIHMTGKHSVKFLISKNTTVLGSRGGWWVQQQHEVVLWLWLFCLLRLFFEGFPKPNYVVNSYSCPPTQQSAQRFISAIYLTALCCTDRDHVTRWVQ